MMSSRREQKVIPMTGDHAQDELNNGTPGNEELSVKLPEQPPWYTAIPYIDGAISFIQLLTYEKLKDLMRWFLDSASFDISIKWDDVTMTMTLFVLFADDMKIMCGTKFIDPGFVTANTICLFFFIFELVSSTWAKSVISSWCPFISRGYVFSFFWYLDIVAILSMFPDISWIADPMGIGSLSNSVGSGNSNYSKAGRVMRLVRLVRLVRLYRIAMQRRMRRIKEKEIMELVRMGLADYEDEMRKMALNEDRGSKLGSQLSEKITQKVIVMVLVIILCLPPLTPVPNNTGPKYAFEILRELNFNPSIPVSTKLQMIDEFTSDLSVDPNASPLYGDGTYILSLRMTSVQNDYLIYHHGLLNSIRSQALLSFSSADLVNGEYVYTEVVYNSNPLLRLTSADSIGLTCFIGAILVVGIVVLSNDAKRLVLKPIERMMNMVETVANDPLSPLQFDHSDSGGYETRLLESTIEKLTGLLRVGFGEAGAGIIKANLAVKEGNSSSSINPLLPGMRVYALVGFCDIHHFEDINYLLKQDVLKFVNTIAEIVHDRVHGWGGQCNKNLGNAFVIIWRIGDEATLLAQQMSATTQKKSAALMHKDSINVLNAATPNRRSVNVRESIDGGTPKEEESSKKKAHVIDLRRVPGVDAMADRALIGYLKIIAEINRNKQVLSYRNDTRLTHNGKEEFKVTMGFGLHAGWAIEGAVGSLQKVDATYLSPHVNMAARLETSSRQYGVPLLASQNFYDLMTPDAQDKCRRLDVVTVKGSEVPIGIYTYDCLQDQLFPDPRAAAQASAQSPPPDATGDARLPRPAGVEISMDSPIAPHGNDSRSPRGIVSRPSVEALSMDPITVHVFKSPLDETDEVFEEDADLLALRSHVTDDFISTFKDGVDQYLAGDWPAARSLLEQADKMMAEVDTMDGDGPCKTLLEYMEERSWTAPPSWKGFRPLTAK